jgi:hypothetical protein
LFSSPWQGEFRYHLLHMIAFIKIAQTERNRTRN